MPNKENAANSINDEPQPISGIIPPLVTPLSDNETLDFHGLERLIEHVIAGGADGLFLLGTTGEGPSLSHALRRILVQRSCQIVDGRVPVYVGVTDTAYAESVELAQHAEESGASAVVLAAPYYFETDQGDLVEYLHHILLELPLPVILYNMPSLTKIVIEPETILDVMRIPNVIGLKDSSGDLKYFKTIVDLLSHRPDWTLLIGPEALLAESIALGGLGGIPGGANVFPELYVDLYKATLKGESKVISAVHKKILRVGEILYGDKPNSYDVIAGIKFALRHLGICGDVMAEPFHGCRDFHIKRIQKRISELLD